MGFVDGHKISGALKLSCNSLTLVLTFFSDSDGLNPCHRAPSRVRGFPKAVKAESSSQGQVGEVVRLQSILAEHIRARCCRCPRHAKEQRRAGIFWAASGVKSRFEVP
ncbi:uncharacterized protein LOC143695694 [Agelaius phoeniceus]|uniref:uncharacterized protein LOC143695694 n=1 Tax=Agelaius phoeniceus TaxID=39638 RepID=UPI004054C326